MPSDTNVRVYLVADAAARSTLDDALAAAQDIEVIGHSSEVARAESEIRRANATVAVIDVRNHESGIEFCRELRDRVPDIVCVVVSGFAGDEARVDSILCGAHGNLDLGADDVPGQLRTAANGGNAVKQFLREARERGSGGGDNPLTQLTYRERHVVRHIVEGRTNREIGEELGLAEKTVRNYVSNILNKLQLENRTQLAVHLARSVDEANGA